GLQACDSFFCGWMGTKQAHQPPSRKRIDDKQMCGCRRTRRHGDALAPCLNLLQRTCQSQRIGAEVCPMFVSRELPRTRDRHLNECRSQRRKDDAEQTSDGMAAL